jgi:hypothetical protein
MRIEEKSSTHSYKHVDPTFTQNVETVTLPHYSDCASRTYGITYVCQFLLSSYRTIFGNGLHMSFALGASLREEG